MRSGGIQTMEKEHQKMETTALPPIPELDEQTCRALAGTRLDPTLGKNHVVALYLDEKKHYHFMGTVDRSREEGIPIKWALLKGQKLKPEMRSHCDALVFVGDFGRQVHEQYQQWLELRVTQNKVEDAEMRLHKVREAAHDKSRNLEELRAHLLDILDGEPFYEGTGPEHYIW